MACEPARNCFSSIGRVQEEPLTGNICLHPLRVPSASGHAHCPLHHCAWRSSLTMTDLCRAVQTRLTQPVVAADGYTYERQALLEYFATFYDGQPFVTYDGPLASQHSAVAELHRGKYAVAAESDAAGVISDQ